MREGTIGDFFLVQGGKRLPKGSRYEDHTTPHPYIRVKDLKPHYVDQSDIVYISKETHKKISKYTIGSGQIFISIAGTIGLAGVVPPELDQANLTENAAKLVPKKGVEVIGAYISYLLNSAAVQQEINRRTMAVGVPKLALFRIKEIPIVIPPLPTQRRIARALDLADRQRRLLREEIAAYDALGESLFLEMFGDPRTNPKGWELKQLSEVADVTMGQSPKGSTYNQNGEGTPLLNGPTEFGNKYPKEKQWTTAPKKLCQPGDILFCVRGATAGRMNWADKKYCLGRGLASITVSKGYSKEYVYLILQSMYNVFQNLSDGSTFINISSKDLNRVSIPQTTERVQNQFANRIQKIESLKAQAEAALTEADDLFNALLQRAFRGELFPQAEPASLEEN